MNSSPRMKLLTLCIGAALAQMASLPVLADTAVGVDTVIGNKANPGFPGVGPVPLDEEMTARHSPSGQMYNIPPVKPDTVQGQLSGSVDIGFEHESDQTDYAKRKEYSDPKNGVNLNNFNLSVDSAAARYFSVNGGGVGRKDQFYELKTGQYNSWKVKGFYNETNHVFTDTWKSLWQGQGTGNLSLPANLKFPTAVTSGSPTVGTGACTAAAPCWSYNGSTYANGVALAAINGVTGTPDSGSGLIPTGTFATGATSGNAAVNGVNGANNAVQSGMAAAIAAQLAATPYSELSLVRKKGGVRGDVTLTDHITAYVGYSLEHRVGARPFSMNENNFSVDTAEPIDYKTHDFMAGMSFNGDLTQVNLRTSASIFRNDIQTMVVQYPLMQAAGPQGVVQHATLALAPSNEAYNIKADIARSLPDFMKSKFTGSVSYTTNRQNEKLLMPISAAENADLTAAGVNSLNGPTAGLASTANPGYSTAMDINNWNGVNGNPLSRTTADQRIDKKLVALALDMHPTDKLSVKPSYRFYDTKNIGGGYLAYNPLTGQWGRGISENQGVATFEANVATADGTTCYAPAGFTAPVGCNPLTNPKVGVTGQPVTSPAYSTRQYNYGIAADYDLTRMSSLNGSVEREVFNRDYRERAQTGENKIKLGYTNRGMESMTLRVSLENDTKRGSNYIYNEHSIVNMANSLPGLTPGGLLVSGATAATAFTNAATYYTFYSYFFRKADLANRDQKILNTRLNWMARENMDVGLNFQIKRADYPEAVYGIKKDNQDSLGLDLNYEPSAGRTITAFYSFQNGHKSLNGNSGGGTQFCTTLADIATYGASACSDTTTGTNGLRPYTADFTENTNDRNNVVGFAWQEDVGFALIGFEYSYARSTTEVSYTNLGSTAFNSYSPKGTIADQAAYAAALGNALPNMTTVQNTVGVNLVKPINKKLTVRASYRFENMAIKDWHYDNVLTGAISAMDGQTLMLDAGPLNYHVNTFGVFMNYKL